MVVNTLSDDYWMWKAVKDLDSDLELGHVVLLRKPDKYAEWARVERIHVASFERPRWGQRSGETLSDNWVVDMDLPVNRRLAELRERRMRLLRNLGLGEVYKAPVYGTKIEKSQSYRMAPKAVIPELGYGSWKIRVTCKPSDEYKVYCVMYAMHTGYPKCWGETVYADREKVVVSFDADLARHDPLRVEINASFDDGEDEGAMRMWEDIRKAGGARAMRRRPYHGFYRDCRSGRLGD